MSQPLTTRPTLQAKQALARKLRKLRLEHFGEEGVTQLAQLLGLPEATWLNYEAGVTIPGEILLAFVILTETEPRWFLQADGT